MAEQLDLTTPIVVTETTDDYQVASILMNKDIVGVPPLAIGEPLPPLPLPPQPPGYVSIVLKDNNGVTKIYDYYGTLAQDMIKFINTGDFTTRSLHRRILERLNTNGELPGTVVGTPEVPSAPTGLE